MIKFWKNTLEIIAWVSIFLFPAALLGLIGFVIYATTNSAWGVAIFIALSLSGTVSGIYLAEKFRGSIGCSTALFRVFTSHDITRWAAGEDKEAEKIKRNNITQQKDNSTS